MKVNQCTQFLKMQGECLDMLTHLIEFDKEQAEKTGEKAENSFALKAFVDTQRKALNMAELLLEKHKDSKPYPIVKTLSFSFFFCSRFKLFAYKKYLELFPSIF